MCLGDGAPKQGSWVGDGFGGSYPYGSGVIGAKGERKIARPRGVKIAERVHRFECPEVASGNVPVPYIVDTVPGRNLGALKAVNAFCDFEVVGPRSFSLTFGARGSPHFLGPG